MKSIRGMNLKFLLILLSCLPFTGAFAVDYYVSDLTGSDSNDGLTTTTAFRAIQKAADLTNPGDTVFIMNGTYSEVKMLYSIHRTVLYISRSGNADEYITYKNYPGHKPKISGENSIWNCVLIRANYIRFEGIELEGPNQSITYEQARAMYDYYVKGENLDWYLIGTMNTNGLTLGANVGTGPRTIFHHIEVRNCIVHNFPGGGIGGADFDYITIENNTVYNNSWYGMYATSGISVFHSQDIDDNITDYKNIVRGNICYNNKTLIPWAGRGYLSDGNGIIIDDNRNSQIAGGIPYTGRTLVENNISYNNGGSGIHAYSSNNVDIINNTAWNNGNVVGYPEIYGQDGTNVNIYNNIMYARTGGACNSNAAGTTYDYNVYFNGPASRQGPNDIVADPKFVRLAVDGTADLRLRSNSPAINSGSDTPGQFSLIDIEGVERPIGAKPDRGAYESEFLEPGIIPEISIWQNSDKITKSGSFDFGEVFYDSPKTVSFMIENSGNTDLKLTGSQVITVTGNGFSLASESDTIIEPHRSTTFEITLTTTSDIDYNGTISIESNGPYENPFHFLVSGKGKDPAKASQQITFNAMPVKNPQDEDFIPEASSSSGLPVAISSSEPTVATVVNGKIHIVGLGTTIITATQEGDESTHSAPSVSQTLSVIPVFNLSATNLVSNPTFNSGTTGWSFAYQNGGSASVASADINGYSSNVGKITIASLGTTSSAYNVQFGTNVQVVAGKQYAIMFKASADADRMVNLFMLKNVSPWTTMFTQNNIALSTIPTTYGPFYYNITTSIENKIFNNKKSIFEVYPNPASNKINVTTSFLQVTKVELRLLNLQGQSLISRLYSAVNDPDTYQLDLNINPGFYLLMLTADEKREVKVIVIQ